MSQTPKHIELILAIVLAAVTIAGSLVFLGLQMRQNAARSAPFNEEQLVKRIKTELLAELANSEILDAQIEAGIQRYIQKQREEQEQARAERQRQAQEQAKNVRPVSPERDHIFGNPDAPVSLIEYSDYECPYCKNFHATVQKVIEAYDGQVNWIYRHYPLQFHNPNAQKEAEAAECAAELGGDEAFWEYTDLIYERTKSNKGFPLDKLAPLAEEIGLDRAAFTECLDSGRYAGRVAEDLKNGQESGITGTPGTILLHHESGEVRLKTGAQPFGTFKADLDQMLKPQ